MPPPPPLYLESHLKNILRVSRPAENCHADDVLSEVYGAISVLDGDGGEEEDCDGSFYIPCAETPLHTHTLTLSNSEKSSSRAELTGSFRNRANSSMVMRPPLHELAMAAKLSSSFLMLSHFRLREQGNTHHCHRYSLSGVSRHPTSCSYLSLRLILVNSTKPASMGSVSSPAEIIRRQSSYVWSVTGTPRALKTVNHINPMIYATFAPEYI